MSTCYPERGVQYSVEGWRNRLEGEREKAVRQATQGEKKMVIWEEDEDGLATQDSERMKRG